MIKGIYSAASAMVAGVNQQQILAHNVANMDTPGFKQIMNSLSDFTQTPVTGMTGSGMLSGLQYLGDLGLGVETTLPTNDFSQGGLQTTGNELDLAISGSGFFCVKTPDGVRYTRDGRFLKDATGQLVTVDGYQVLDQNNQPIKLPDGNPIIDQNGQISVNGQSVGRIGLAAFQDPQAELTRYANNAFESSGAPTGTTPGTIQQFSLESSNADAAQLMAQMVEISRSYEAAQQMVQNQDELLGETISTLGRIG